MDKIEVLGVTPLARNSLNCVRALYSGRAAISFSFCFRNLSRRPLLAADDARHFFQISLRHFRKLVNALFCIRFISFVGRVCLFGDAAARNQSHRPSQDQRRRFKCQVFRMSRVNSWNGLFCKFSTSRRWIIYIINYFFSSLNLSTTSFGNNNSIHCRHRSRYRRQVRVIPMFLKLKTTSDIGRHSHT